MFERVPKPVKVVLGSLLVGVGVIGLLVPIMPGWALIIPGALLLGFDVAIIARYLRHTEKRWPRWRPWSEKLRGMLPSEKTESSERV
jgi:hypothetical protein